MPHSYHCSEKETTRVVSRKIHVLTQTSTRTHWSEYAYLLKCLRVNTFIITRTYYRGLS